METLLLLKCFFHEKKTPVILYLPPFKFQKSAQYVLRFVVVILIQKQFFSKTVGAFKWEVRIYESGSCNYDVRCVQITLIRDGNVPFLQKIPFVKSNPTK